MKGNDIISKHLKAAQSEIERDLKRLQQRENLELHLKALAIHDANNTMLTLDECADFLNITTKTVSSRIRTGKIIAQHHGKWAIPKLQFVEKIIEKILTQ